MEKALLEKIMNYKRKLDNGADVQCLLEDLIDAKQDSVWQEAILNVMWKVGHLIQSDEAFCDCMDNGYNYDLMFLINHDGNYSFFVNEKDITSDKEPTPVSRKTADKIFDRVIKHPEGIDNFISNSKYADKCLLEND